MEWQNVLEYLVCKSKPKQTLKATINREDELMSYLWTDQNMIKLVSLWLRDHYDKKELKSIAKAEAFKSTGNKEFQTKNYTQSIHFYTKCALYAPVGSNELPLAIANRSAALFYLNRYNDCIKDVELAIKLNYPKNLCYKLYLRAAQCYLKLGDRNMAEKTISKIREIMNDPDYIAPSIKDTIEKRISEMTFTDPSLQSDTQITDDLLKLKSNIIFNENPNFPHASINIDKKNDKELGRYVVANRFIKKGEILFLEEPVSFVLLDQDTSNQFCSQCNTLNTDIPVPCTECLNTFYHDTKCSEEAWSSYHCWECPGSQMSLWREIGIGHLALKVLLTCTTTIDRIKFNEMQNLVTNFDKLSIEDLTVYGITSAMLTIYLLEYTDYFKVHNLNHCLMEKFFDNTFNLNFSILTDSDKRLYVSSLLLRYILQLICNGHAITTLNLLLNKNDSSMDQQDIVATGIYPSASMMNHSCDPNIINIFVKQYLIVRAAKDIAKNEEIFNCYGPHYRHMSRDQRQNILKSQYCFTCKCKPCTQSDLKYFLERFSSMVCLKCTGALYTIENSLYCLDCNDKPKNHYQSKLQQAEELFEEAQSSIDVGDTKEALDKLKKCLRIRKTILYKYNKDISLTLNVMENIYTSRGQWMDSIECLEEIIIAVRQQFGSSSVEFFNELNRLTDAYILYLQKELDNTTDTYKNILKKTHRYLDQLEEIAGFNYGSWSKIYENTKKKREKIITIS